MFETYIYKGFVIKMSYNGWSNYETWCCKLWLDNDKGLYDKIQEWVSNDQDENKLSKKIGDLVYALCPDLPLSMFSDLLNSALNEIDFNEIAESLIKDWIAENKTTEPIDCNIGINET